MRYRGNVPPVMEAENQAMPYFGVPKILFMADRWA
jgi:hypothetical protein